MVKKKYFLVYIDILGFEERAEKEAEKSSIRPEEVRSIYRERIKHKLNQLKENETVLDSQEMSLDSWLLFTDNIWKAFRSVGEVFKTNLPFEIAIGAKDFDESPAGEELIALRNETMDYLKISILRPCKKWYEEKYKKTIGHTFILLTPEAYKELESQKGKRIARKPYKSANFYLIKQKEFDRRLEVLEFLEKIGSQRIEYREIEKLYVKPENYKEIERILKDNNIVFIIGDAEIGKTYTAIKLLFEFFKEGYEPVYIPEERRREQWAFVRHTTELEGKAVYLEDPWGKVEFERVESLFRDVGNLIAKARRKRCKVIITSREKVFKEFEKKKETAEDLWKYVSELKVNLAYSTWNLMEILKRYIKIFEPLWCYNKNLREIAFEAVREKLRTPMSIKQLIDYTQDAKDEDNLNAGIAKASEETKIAFAKEIKEMFNAGKYDNLVFLSFPYIEIKLEVAKSCYEEILRDLGYDLVKAKDFDDLLEEFNEVEFWLWDDEIVNYIHPSYKDAFGSALMDDNQPNNISKRIFSKVLFKLSEKEEATDDVVWAIAENFDKLSEDIRNLLLKFFKKDRAPRAIEEVIVDNLDMLPENARNKLLFKLSEKDETAEYVAWAVAENFDVLTENIRNELLFRLSEKEETADDVARTVEENFDKLPEAVRNELLLKLSEKEKAAEYVTWAVSENFDKLPEEVRNELLLKLSEKEKATWGIAWRLAWAVSENFDKLPEAVRNKLLLKLSQKEVAAKDVARAVVENFDKLPEEVRNELLLKLSQKEVAAKDVARAVVENFDKLPKEVRNELLLKLSQKEEVAEYVSWAVAENFDKLPEDVKNLLNRLQDQLQCVIENLSRGTSQNKISAIEVISNARSKIDKNFALSVLGSLSRDENEEVGMKAEKLKWTLFLGIENE